jgi:hypothetical protein
METLTSTLLGLTIPIAVGAIALGVIAMIRASLLMNHGMGLRRSPVTERFAMFICAVCATVAALMTAGALRDGNYVVASLAFALLVFAGAGVGLYFTSRRPLSEALAAVAMGIFAILSGFSIGVYVAPFALALGVLASHHLRIERRSPERS